MHIGFLTPEYPDSRRPDGGLGNYIRKIGMELISHGHHVSVFVLSRESKFWDDNGIQIHQIKEFRFHWRLRKLQFFSGWFSLIEQLVNGRKLRKFVLQNHIKNHIDILQTSNFRAPGYSLCNNGLIPLVCRCSYYLPVLYALNGVRRTLVKTFEERLENSTVLKADGVFAPSHLVANLYEQYEHIQPKVIRTPVNIQGVVFDDSIYHQYLKGKKYLLFFGTLMGVKGVDILIDTLPLILSSHPGLMFAFIGHNGPIPGGKETALDLLHRKLNDFNDQVFYHPSLDQSQLFPIIQNSIGVVMPSRIDNYPNACLESFALGIPVIGTYGSSLDEIIDEGKTGFLAKNGDPDSLYQAIYRLLKLNGFEKQQMEENIKKQVGLFKEEKRVERLIDFYNEILENFRK